MLISNTIKRLKLKYLTFIILCTIPLLSFSQETESLNPVSLESILLETLPLDGRVVDDDDSFEELYDDLLLAEVVTTDDLHALINTQLIPVLDIEKEICKQMIESEELSATVSNGTYTASLEDVEWIRKGFYFTVVGLVRTMLDLTHETDETEFEDI
ncbi:hypothetical protein [Dysgonomonas sp. GY617]|uniref:hypothetical protein n=1 Tax=Dysgonomonas sp. GY617 TaxID=2780420 RepID=UPI001883FD14|nr:hypothetical protein [Dysgonomonas sp. GY617]MBF0574819.1 hypothetical protein [Dysgonomonas sp. GY617]